MNKGTYSERSEAATAALAAEWDAEGHLLTEAEMAERLAVDPSTLRVWHREGVGPPRLQVGPRTVRYAKSDATRWLRGLREAAQPA